MNLILVLYLSTKIHFRSEINKGEGVLLNGVLLEKFQSQEIHKNLIIMIKTQNNK
jgi:hypothetical protein